MNQELRLTVECIEDGGLFGGPTRRERQQRERQETVYDDIVCVVNWSLLRNDAPTDEDVLAFCSNNPLGWPTGILRRNTQMCLDTERIVRDASYSRSVIRDFEFVGCQFCSHEPCYWLKIRGLVAYLAHLRGWNGEYDSSIEDMTDEDRKHRRGFYFWIISRICWGFPVYLMEKAIPMCCARALRSLYPDSRGHYDDTFDA